MVSPWWWYHHDDGITRWWYHHGDGITMVMDGMFVFLLLRFFIISREMFRFGSWKRAYNMEAFFTSRVLTVVIYTQQYSRCQDNYPWSRWSIIISPKKLLTLRECPTQKLVVQRFELLQIKALCKYLLLYHVWSDGSRHVVSVFSRVLDAFTFTFKRNTFRCIFIYSMKYLM